MIFYKNKIIYKKIKNIKIEKIEKIKKIKEIKNKFKLDYFLKHNLQQLNLFLLI